METRPSQRVVVKFGSSVLTGGSLKLDRAHMLELVRQCVALKRQGHQVIVVTSAAIAAGREHLGYPELPKTVASKQMLAAVGQSRLIHVWEELFAIYGYHVGQMLLTRADLDDRGRYLNARDTLMTLLEHDIIPVINENDAVATTEIKVGDNDNLSAMVAILAHADKLILLTDQRGLFTADPRTNPNAELIREVHTIDETLRKLAGGSGTTLGTGGMATKLQAADIARRAGIEVTIAAGGQPQLIQDVVNGDAEGTRFLAMTSPLESRKQWILAGPPASGDIVLDAGAVAAVTTKNSSLLPKGITAIRGDFRRGCLVRLCDAEGHVIGRGLCRYDAKEMALIMGQHSDRIGEILGYEYGHVAIHRDDLVLI
ncbi:glutamate 5-kinase [Vibrio stylophorae]|nr:glutamate 5-kinase [Vibrio stylophorae]